MSTKELNLLATQALTGRWLVMSWPARLFAKRRLIFSGAFTVVFLWFLTFTTTRTRFSEWQPPIHFLTPGQRMAQRIPLPPLADRVPCYGPRDRLLTESVDDEVRAADHVDRPYPVPFVGSYEAVGIEKSWLSMDGRYGPYGYGEEKEGYNRTRVAWDKIDWGHVQNRCFERNAHRFPPEAVKFDANVRFGLANGTAHPNYERWGQLSNTRRTAILVRAWKGYDYKAEDLHYLRSLITETSLKTGGEYQVILFVDTKDASKNIFASKEAYGEALEKAGIPPELRSITVLWDDKLLESWYPNVQEHRTMWQVYQPVQLFSLHYPEFDHVWQLELDMRFTGDAGKYLDALDAFARKEPRKQALERATFQHFQSEIGSYENFTAAVDRANKGSAHVWGPMRNPDIEPIGPEPPVSRASLDHFEWGVGEDADALMTSFCAKVSTSRTWVFRDWIGGFSGPGRQAMRYFCPPAIQRASRTLLLAIHGHQAGPQGMHIPSESTLPTFALWHGLKLSYPPHPLYWRVDDDKKMVEGWWKGGPESSPEGLGPSDPSHPGGDGLSFWWESSWPRLVMDAWMGEKPKPGDADFPWLMAAQDGVVYMPNMMLHPMKHKT